MAARRIVKEIDYPSSDGKPMAEGEVHWDWMVNITLRLRQHFAGQRVHVSSDLLIYYEEGSPRKRVAPNTFVVKNCRPRLRDNFLIWKERRTPIFVLETTSRKTQHQDARVKKKKYALIGVAEYFLYDPRAEWLAPPLRGYRLEQGKYKMILVDADGGIVSKELGIRFILEKNNDLAMFDVATGERLQRLAHARTYSA